MKIAKLITRRRGVYYMKTRQEAMGKEAIVNTEKGRRNSRQEAIGKEAKVNTEKGRRHKGNKAQRNTKQETIVIQI